MKTIEEVRKLLKTYCSMGNHVSSPCKMLEGEMNERYQMYLSRYRVDEIDSVDICAIYGHLLDIAELTDSVEVVRDYVLKLYQTHKTARKLLEYAEIEFDEGISPEEKEKLMEEVSRRRHTHSLYESQMEWFNDVIMGDSDYYPNEDGEDEDAYLIQQERRNDFAYQMDNWGMEDY